MIEERRHYHVVFITCYCIFLLILFQKLQADFEVNLDYAMKIMTTARTHLPRKLGLANIVDYSYSLCGVLSFSVLFLCLQHGFTKN